jgi:hypothetical protein
VVKATGARSTATESFRASSGCVLSAASAMVVPCECPE